MPGMDGPGRWRTFVICAASIGDLRRAKNKDFAGAGVGVGEIAIGGGSDETRHGEGAAAQLHVFLIVGNGCIGD